MIQGFVSSQALALLFIFFGLAIAVIIKQIRKKFQKIPYTPTLFLISMGLGYFSPYIGIIGESIKEISSIDPRGILLIFLPPLIFESSFNSDWYIFRKQSVQIFILAFPSVLVSAFFIMLSIKVFIVSAQSYYEWPQAFMFGSVLSCTDTVAVLALLKEAGAPRKFSSLIEGQSLFNDGTCMVLFTISLELVKGKAPPVLYIGQLFLELTLGAIILGVIFGFLSSNLIKFVRNDAILTLNITVVSCYILYFTAEYVDLGIHVSGIMSLVSMGLYMAAFGKTQITADAKNIVHGFWKIYIFVAETIIFILGGVIVGRQALRPQFVNMMNWMNLFGLAQLYLYMTLARFLSITIFMWKLKYEGYGLKWTEVIALTHGGLRGAVGIAFTLILASNESLSPTFQMASLFNTSGCAFLTLMINAPTAKFVINKLGLCVKSDTKIRLFKQFLKECQVDLTNKMDDLKKNKYLFNSLWDTVEEQGGINELKCHIKETAQKTSNSLHDLKERQMHHIRSNLLSEQAFDEIDQALLQEIRNRFCVALKGILWEKFQKNQCSRQSILSLIECVNLDLDSINEPLNSWDYLVNHIHNPYFFPLCFWLKNIPIVGKYASKQIYWRVNLLYDIVSTYIQALQDCEQACKMLPFEQYVLSRIVEESTQNRKLAQSFLDNEIKISYDEIMKKIQTSKAAQSLLTFQKMYINKARNLKQIDGYFEQKLRNIIDNNLLKLESDSGASKQLNGLQILRSNELFKNLPQLDLLNLLAKKVDLLIQKDESVIKPYEKQKYVYLISSGVIRQEYKIGNRTLVKRNKGLYELVGLGSMLLSNKKQLQMSAIGVSVVSVFCFPLNSLKQLMSNNNRLEEEFYNEIFILHLKQNEELASKISLSEEGWRLKKQTTWYKKVHKRNEETVRDCFIILIQGKIKIQGKEYKEGYYQVKGEATVWGPAKFYANKLPFESEEREMSLPRSSTVRRLSTDMVKKQTSIIRRTLYTRD